MKFLSVCSGIEAASVAWTPLGFEAVAFAEVEKFPCAVLAHHYPGVPNLGDMTKIEGEKYRGAVDILVGGTPCQAFSVAGLRAGLVDPRGNLTLVFAKLADDIAPPYVVWENVPGVLSSKDNAFGCFLGLLAGEDDALVAPGGKWTDAGYVLGPQRTVAWRVLDAQYFGLAQRRRRVFVVACPRGGVCDPREILFEREGLRRDTPPSREAGEGAAASVTAGARKCDHAGSVAGGLTLECVTGQITHALKAEGADASEDGTGRGGSSNLEIREDGTANALLTPNGGRGGIGVGAVAFNHQSGVGFTCSENTVPCMIKNQTNAVAYGFRHMASPCDGNPILEEQTPTLRRGDQTGQAFFSAHQVRRLTPRECCRLQGFPDDYTRIPWRGKPAKRCPDGPRYKALGNSMAVPCMAFIGARIKRSSQK